MQYRVSSLATETIKLADYLLRNENIDSESDNEMIVDAQERAYEKVENVLEVQEDTWETKQLYEVIFVYNEDDCAGKDCSDDDNGESLPEETKQACQKWADLVVEYYDESLRKIDEGN